MSEDDFHEANYCECGEEISVADHVCDECIEAAQKDWMYQHDKKREEFEKEEDERRNYYLTGGYRGSLQ